MFRYSTALFTDFLATLKTQLDTGVIHFYSGSQPASPDDAITGTLIATVSVSAGAWTAGVATNGLHFATPALASIDKASAEEWKFITVAAGTIGWGRFVSNSASDTGAASTTLRRVDFSVGVTSGDARMSKVTYALGETGTCSSFLIPLSNIA